MSKGDELIPQSLVDSIRDIVAQERGRIQQTVNANMVQAYWHIGRVIVEMEQQGAQRTGFGTPTRQICTTPPSTLASSRRTWGVMSRWIRR